MAALIGGTTIHGWGQVPVNMSAMTAKEQKKGLSDVDALFLRSQSIRWLIIDEISTTAAIVAGVFESNLRRARA